MIPFYVMVAAIITIRVVGAFAWPALDNWQVATRLGLAVMFVFTGVAHFTNTRHDLIRMVPPKLPNPSAFVTLTGVAELAGAAGLAIPSTSERAAYALIVLLVAMFPANIHAARIGHTIGGRRHTRMALRLPLQLLWIGLLWWSHTEATRVVLDEHVAHISSISGDRVWFRLACRAFSAIQFPGGANEADEIKGV